MPIRLLLQSSHFPALRLQSLQQLVKRLVVLCRVLVPVAEIADNFAQNIRFTLMFPGVEDVVVNANGKQDASNQIGSVRLVRFRFSWK
jgi:hypothetical protein